MKKWALILFILASFVELIAIFFELPIRMFSKPLLMIFLLVYYLAHKEARNPIMIAALILAWFGDVFLLGNAENNFIFGLLSFLAMQLCYAYVFFRQTAIWRKIDSIFTFFMIIYVLGFVYYLWPSLGEFKLPVSVYASVFALVSLLAFWRHKKFNGWMMVLIGVLLFVLSDSIIAINRFKISIPKADLWIMLTYISGQFLIIEGYIKSRVLK